MSFDAIRWALAQPVKAATKLVLVAMADCVNAEGGEVLCWPSYRYLASRCGLDAKTVEAAVYRLREQGYIKDTGKKRGETGKVVVYLLNTTKNGGITSGPEGEGGSMPQHANNPEIGGVKPESNDPVIPPNPPKTPTQSPQNSHITTPETGYGSRKEPVNRSRKEPGRGACARPLDVSEQVWTDWTALRAKKRTTVSESAITEARRECAIAGMTLERFLQVWCARGSQGLQADWLRPDERSPATRAPNRADQRAATIAGLTGTTERNSHAAGQPSAIDVESRLID